MKATILCVDDVIDNLDALERLFRRDYNVLRASSGSQALEILQQHPVQVIISDQRMPQMTGVEFLKKSIPLQPEATRILLTGYADIESVIAAINDGEIYRYVAKPWESHDLIQTVSRGVERYELARELKDKNAKLEKALNELQTLDAAKTEFMLLINHELRTPLTAISSFIELLQETQLNEEQQHFLNRITQNSDRLYKLVSDTLELVSAQTGQVKPNPRRLSPRLALDALTTKFHKQAQLKNLSFVIEADDQEVSADPQILTNVLERLTENAVKFSNPGQKVHLKTQVKSDQIEFSLENSGEPLSNDVIEKVMKPFHLNEDMMNHSKGLGLGLSISEALLKSHQSMLKLESDEQSTRVRFSLPVSEKNNV